MRAACLLPTMLMLVAATLAGCAGKRGGNIAYAPAGFTAPDAPPPATAAADHKLGAGDVITVSVYQVDNLSGEHTIDTAGRITLPLVGAVEVQGKTAPEVATLLKERLGERYLKSPQVNVGVKSIIQKTVTVDGSVKQPGIYPLPPRISLLQVIALARGPDENANLRRVVVFRQIGGQRQAAAFDLKSIRDGEMKDPDIYGDDVVVVDGSGVKSAFRNLMQSVPLLAVFGPL
ncbi:polysaccharide biosynthesis/export family protein [Sphingomonas sp. 1P06PA]|uniref:polysaccharide biosynthesis/export family protein n=1 Tax=Sphingomonas sp. 1P06PA TaxID=554121 RepID=UPI0039A7719A